jgi:Uma2 family endonuclease
MALVVEVAESSLQNDRMVKSRLYARAGVQVYWIVNLPDRAIEVYTDPTGPDPLPAYRRYEVVRDSDTLALVIDGCTIAHLLAQDLLP